MKNPNVSLQESLFDQELAKKDIGTLTVITNALENYLAGNKTEYGWVRTLVALVNDIKYNLDFRKRHPMSYEKAMAMKKDELYVIIDVNGGTKQIILLGKGVLIDRPSFPTACIIRYSSNIKNIYADLYASATTDYKELTNNANFQWYKVSNDELKAFNNEILDNIEQVF